MDKNKRNFWIGMGLVSMLLALSNEFDGAGQRPTGRWSWVTGPLFDAFGNRGISALWLAIGALCILAALLGQKR